MKANAVIFTEPNAMAFREINCPDPGPDHAVIRLTHSWISPGTEGSYLRGERIAGDTPYVEGGPWPFPIVSGYQGVGVVESVGSNISDLDIGETVYRNVGAVDGMYHDVGGHVSPSICERDWIFKIPAGCDPLAVSGLLLTQVGYNCGTRIPVEKGEHAAVIGDGLVGQWAAQTLSSLGALVIMVGMDNDRLALAERYASAQTVNFTETDWVAAVGEFAPEGLAQAVDAVGSRESAEKLIGLLRQRGHIVSAGFYGTDDRFAIQPLRDKEISIDTLSSGTPERIVRTMELVTEGVLQTLPLITHHFPVAEAEKAWGVINGRNEHVLGVILDW